MAQGGLMSITTMISMMQVQLHQVGGEPPDGDDVMAMRSPINGNGQNLIKRGGRYHASGVLQSVQ